MTKARINTVSPNLFTASDVGRWGPGQNQAVREQTRFVTAPTGFSRFVAALKKILLG